MRRSVQYVAGLVVLILPMGIVLVSVAMMKGASPLDLGARKGNAANLGERTRTNENAQAPVSQQNQSMTKNGQGKTPLSSDGKGMFTLFLENISDGGNKNSEMDKKRAEILKRVENETPEELVANLIHSPDTPVFCSRLERQQNETSVYDPVSQYNELLKDPRVAKLVELIRAGDSDVLSGIAVSLRSEIGRLVAGEIEFYSNEGTATPVLPVLLAEADPSMGTLDLLEELIDSQAHYVDESGNVVDNQLWQNMPLDAQNMCCLAVERVLDRFRNEPGDLTAEQRDLLQRYASRIDERLSLARQWAQQQPEYAEASGQGLMTEDNLRFVGDVFSSNVYGIDCSQAIREHRQFVFDILRQFLDESAVR